MRPLRTTQTTSLIYPTLMIITVSAYYMRDVLHWLPIAHRISYRMAVLVVIPAYLCELCRLVSGLPGRWALHSSVIGQLLVPRAKTATRQRRAFSIVGPSTWNGLPLGNLPPA